MLHQLLGTQPDGRPLYRYRLTSAQYAEGREALVQRFQRRSFTDATREEAALFCVLASEWWRREHKDGPWRWEGIFDGLGLRAPAHNDIAPVVAKGLLVLDRPLFQGARGTEYLGTLVVEGGLPLARLTHERANVSAYLNAIFEHAERMGMTGEEHAQKWTDVAADPARAALLPATQQKEVVFRLCGELAGQIWRLRGLLAGSTGKPIAVLDQKDPSWRDALPIALDDDKARMLLEGLVADVAKVARATAAEARVVTRLVLAPESASLQRVLSLPDTLTAEQVAESFGDFPSAQAIQVRLRRANGEGVRAGMLTRTGPTSWAWRADAGVAVVGTSATESVVVEALTRQGARQERDNLAGAAALGPLPWVFRNTLGNEWELVGEGSVSRRQAELLVAVPPGVKATGDLTPAGKLLDRDLVRVHGTATFVMEAGDVRIRTQQTEDSPSGFELFGPRYHGPMEARTRPWMGMPQVRGRLGTTIVAATLEAHSGGRWSPAMPAQIGRVRVRARRGNELVFQDDIVVVPKDFSVSLRPD